MRKGHCISFRVASIEGASHVFGIGSWQRSNIAGTLSRGKVSSGEEGLTGETISLSYTFRDNCRTSWETLSVCAAEVDEAWVYGPNEQWDYVDRNTNQREWLLHRWSFHSALWRSGGTWFSYWGEIPSEAFEVRWDGQTILLMFHIAVGVAHPRVTFNNLRKSVECYTWRVAGEQVRVSASIYETGDHPNPRLIGVSRLPNGYRSTVVLTDHADFDEPRGLQELLWGQVGFDGLLGMGLPITKSIFVRRKKGQPNGDLGSTEFQGVIDRFDADGGEVALHLTRDIPTRRDILAKDLASVRHYDICTWIDHANDLPQAVSVCGTIRGSEFYNLDLLTGSGIRHFWSYIDIKKDFRPFRWGISDCAYLGKQAWYVVQRIAAARGLLPEHVERLRGIALGVLRGIGGYRGLSAIQDAITAFNQWVYQPLFLDRSGTGSRVYFFNSHLISDLTLLDRRRLDELVRDHGWLIAHVYLCEQWRDARRGGARAGVKAAARDLRELRDRGEIWVATLRDLVAWLERRQNVLLRPAGGGRIEIENAGGGDVDGVTLVAAGVAGGNCWGAETIGRLRVRERRQVGARGYGGR